MRGTDDTLESSSDDFYSGKFPEAFKFGTVTFAHQIEGRWAGDGKGDSIWDEFSQSQPERISDKSTPDEACDSYHKFETDVFLLKSMNANSYMLSLNWSRILPDGTTASVNLKGLNYYNNLINTLLENGIEPVVILHDSDFPSDLLKKYSGGWTNPGMIDAFASFANLCFCKFGDRVQSWITLVKPWSHSLRSYGEGVHPPNVKLGLEGSLSAHANLLRAHERVYSLYKMKFREAQGGKVGIFIGCGVDDCVDSHEESCKAQLNRELYPLTYGEYPSSVSFLGNTNLFKNEQMEMIIIYDFVVVDFNSNFSATGSNEPSCEMLSSALNLIREDYKNPEVLLSFAGPAIRRCSQTFMDMDRAHGFNKVANELLKAIDLDGCNIRGYFPGKLMDCWEGEAGYSISHGLYHVDFSSPSKKRSPRASVAFALKQLFKEKAFLPTTYN